MKKLFKGLICAGLCGVLAVGATGCGKSEHRDAETTPLNLAIGSVDQKFNPMFYTSQNDGVIANLTQISLLTSDAKGNLAFGEDQPTVALDYRETYYDANGSEIGHGNGITVEGESSTNGSTAYEFLIKDGIKFSDGEPLTVMDVLFNLYVYLDPAYNGSSTIYSTKIKGLQAYRQQDPQADENSSISMTQYYAPALTRLNSLIQWSSRNGTDTLSAQQQADLETVKELYKEELESDWSSIETSWHETYKNEYSFTEAWQAFYLIENVIQVQTEMDPSTGLEVDKKVDGKYVTTLEPDASGDVLHQALIDDIEEATSAAKVAEYIASHEGYTEENAKLALQREHAIEFVYESNTIDSEIDYILTYCATGSTALDAFILDEMSNDRVEGELEVKNISGISVHKAKEFNGKTYDSDRDVLRVEINGVDPKAKWNFGFSVAPMHYYSDAEHTAAAMAAYNNGTVYTAACKDFGVEYMDINWINSTLSNDKKNGLPVGAGPYKCTSHNYSSSSYDPSKLTSEDFFYNYQAFFERNENFETLGKGIDNAKIKYVKYKVIRDDKIVEALKTGEIDYGEPTATSDNQRELNTGTLKQITYLAGGYGYIGINPKYVPDIEVRQAIMHAFNTASIIEYYGRSLVNLINRPMSTTSWAYPTDSQRKYELWTDTQQIIDLVASSNNWDYNQKDKKFHKRGDFSTTLDLTFTIAGETTDHPSYNMLVEAEDFLEKCGFNISVVTDIQALKKLATGDLAVWAAAWSSSIDPDPYQVYSINSNATSTKNWYKDGIVREGQPAGSELHYEYEKAVELNTKIEEGRQTLNQAVRKDIYSECLDLIMDLAVEFPTYQRYDLCVYNSAVLNDKTMHKNDASFNMGPISELWKVAFKK